MSISMMVMSKTIKENEDSSAASVYFIFVSQVCYSKEMQHVIGVSFMLFHCNFIEYNDSTANKPAIW